MSSSTLHSVGRHRTELVPKSLVKFRCVLELKSDRLSEAEDRSIIFQQLTNVFVSGARRNPSGTIELRTVVAELAGGSSALRWLELCGPIESITYTLFEARQDHRRAEDTEERCR